MLKGSQDTCTVSCILSIKCMCVLRVIYERKLSTNDFRDFIAKHKYRLSVNSETTP
jgi:hypothetical protein